MSGPLLESFSVKNIVNSYGFQAKQNDRLNDWRYILNTRRNERSLSRFFGPASLGTPSSSFNVLTVNRIPVLFHTGDISRIRTRSKLYGNGY